METNEIKGCWPRVPRRQYYFVSSNIKMSSINETDRHDIAEILLKVALNTITLILYCQLVVKLSRKP